MCVGHVLRGLQLGVGAEMGAIQMLNGGGLLLMADQGYRGYQIGGEVEVKRAFCASDSVDN